MKALLDTNILIDYLNGIEAARQEIRLYDKPLISPITWMEVMVGHRIDDDELKIRAFLDRFRQVEIDAEVAEQAVAIRRHHRIRLPDAIIWASARKEDALLVSRNHKDFPSDDPGIRIPYKL
jgi:predicted nucleic acid-binding protein